MEGKRLDLDAPLISVRRITAFSAPSKDGKPQLRRGALRSGHVENCGAVPFIWEKRPGHPKDDTDCIAEAVAGGSMAAPNLPPARILINASQPKPDPVRTRTPIICSSDCGTEKLITGGMGLNPADCGEGCDAFSDSRDTISCNESFSMKSGVAGLSARPRFRDSTSQFSKDLQMEEYMMDRFLHAAQAVASGLPQQIWKKPPRAPAVDNNSERKTVPRRRLPLHWQYQLSAAASHDNGWKKEEKEEEKDAEQSGETESCEGTGYFSSKARGLISRFGLKSSFCLMNPVPGIKVRDLPPTKPSPHIKISNDEGIVENSWEAVYRHRLRNVDYIQKDVDSKISTESNQLTYWIDSQTQESSSSFHQSSLDAPSPNNNENVKNKSKSSKTGSFDSLKEDIGSYREMATGIGRLQGSGSTCSTTDRFHINSSQLPDSSNSNSSLVSKTAGTKESTDSGYTLLSEFQRTKESATIAETSEGYQPQSQFSRVAEPSFSSHSNTLHGENKNGNGFEIIQRNDVGFDLKADGQEKNIDNSLALSLLPPPLPKPPSDSWLQRALPTISAKGPYRQSFLGIQFHPMNQTLQASRSGQKLVIPEKSSKVLPYQTTFAGVPKPAC